MTGFATTLIRRWYLTILGVGLTAVLCLVAGATVHPTYQASASLLLLPPESSVETGGNPYLELGGLTQVVDVLARALNAEEMTDAVAEIDRKATYTAESDVTTSGPILLLTVDGTTSASTLAVLATLIQHGPSTLTNLQAALGIAKRSQITSIVLIRDAVATPVQKTRIRILAAAAAGGLVVTLFAVAVIDGLLTSRRGRKRVGSRVELDVHDGGAGAAGAIRMVEPTAPPEVGRSTVSAPAPARAAPNIRPANRNRLRPGGVRDELSDGTITRRVLAAPPTPTDGTNRTHSDHGALGHLRNGGTSDGSPPRAQSDAGRA